MKVSTILDNIDDGSIALPEFQRGYVWNRGQVRGLFDSLYRGLPVGGLLTWQTRTENADARGNGALRPGVVQLLLDGQQRITSLYGVVRGHAPTFFQGNEQAFTGLRFHLDDERFEFWQPVKMRDDPLWIDVSDLMRRGSGSVLSEWMTKLAGDPEGPDRLQRYMDRLGRIDRIKEREFHVESVTGEDKTVETVVHIFNQVNSGGTTLSKGDLALAKICATWPEAREELRARLRKWADAGFHFRLDWLLRCVTAIVTDRAEFAYLADRGAAEVREGLDRAERAIDLLLNTIGGRLGLDHDSVLKGDGALPLMCRYVCDRGLRLDHRERDRLLYWYLHAYMWGRYASSTETALNADLTAIRGRGADGIDRLVALLSQQRGDLTVRPGDFHAWSLGARFYPVLYMLSRVRGARDWITGVPISRHAIGRQARLEVHHIFPKKVLRDAGYSMPQANQIANFTFLTEETNRALGARLPADYFPEIAAGQPGTLESHWVPTEPELREPDHYGAFLERRRVALAAAANAFLAELWEGMVAEAAEPVATPEPAAAAAVAIVAPDDRDADEARELADLRAWLTSQGLDAGEMDHELVDEHGHQDAVLDLAWPHGLQSRLTHPVALILNEPPEVADAASNHGYRYFRTTDALKRYAHEILLLGEAA